VKRVFLNGMSGTGKSSVISELAVRGYKAIDTDYGGWSEVVDVPPSAGPTGLGEGKDWLWQEDRIARLLATEDADVLFISGGASNQGTFYARFDHIVLLTAPIELIKERLTHRTNNPYGRNSNDLARVLALKERVEPVLRRIADIEIDTSIPLEQVVERLLSVVFAAESRP
jgi:shikimate kinase